MPCHYAVDVGIGRHDSSLRSDSFYRQLLSDIVRTHFPEIAKRLQNCIDDISLRFKVVAGPFGLFWNFCINAPADGIEHVVCRPHVDAQMGPC